jgi:hypothetical protein
MNVQPATSVRLDGGIAPGLCLQTVRGEVLTAFEAFPQWNPFIRTVSAELREEGRRPLLPCAAGFLLGVSLAGLGE